MMPIDDARGFDRRLFLAFGVAACAGCAMPLTRGQTPEVEEQPDEKELELVGDYARPWGLNWIKLEAIALVTNLDKTGSDPPPSPQRQALIGEMQSHEVRNADQILASSTTSLVLLRGYLPPAVEKGDSFDVEVLVPSRSETTSLRGGWLMQSRMRQMEALDGSIRTGSVDALAHGAVIVDALFSAQAEKVKELRGRVPGGGRSLISRDLGLAIGRQDASIRMSTSIAKAVNARFFTSEGGTRRGVANPTRDNYLELSVSPRYRHNLARYLRVIRNIALRETPVERTERLALLEKKLLEPASCALASLQLEAIGNEAASALRGGLKSSDPEVRFYAAEALAYLDQPESAAPLAEAAKREPAFRWHALTALSTLTHVAALDALTGLLHVDSVETRYGAFRALRTRNPGDPTTKGEVLGGHFSYHVLATTSEPLIHLTRTRAPEIVVFGHEQKLQNVTLLNAGKQIMITPLDSGDLRAGRYHPGEETVYESFPPELDKLIRTIVKLGGGYTEVVSCLQQAKAAGCLQARLAIEATPKPNRQYYRDDDPLPDAPEEEANEGDAAEPSAARQPATPSPELFRDRLDRDQADEPASKATVDGAYVAPEYEPKEPTFLDKINPFSATQPAAE